jgi:RNA polymerase subunit RPABC4/transcription elongation factor Spt4
MKQCRECEAIIPDDAKLCPHCRVAQRHGEWLPQATLVGLSVAAALAVVLEGCPGLPLG